MRLTRPLVPITAIGLTFTLGACGGGQESEGETEMRTVDSIFGEATIPADPERVVVVRSATLDVLMGLGIEPVGSTYWGAAGGIPEYLGGEDSGIELVGDDDEPDFEAIAALEPDLIVTSELAESYLDVLQDIAPVVGHQRVNEDGSADWHEHIEDLGELLNREDEAQATLANVEQRAEEVDEANNYEGETLIPTRVRADHVRHMLPEGPFGATFLGSLDTLELVEPEVPTELDEWAVLPPEQLGELDRSDWLLAVIDDQEALDNVESQTLWQQLGSVENNKVCLSENLTAWAISGPSAAMVQADDIEECLSSTDR